MMGGIVWLGYQALGDWFDDVFYKRCIALGLLIGSGMAVYTAFVLALKVTSISELKASFRRG